MIAIYAMGDGLGHLTRAAAAVHTLGVRPEEVVVLTSSIHAGDRRVTGSMAVRRVEPTDVASELADVRPDELWVDAFPAGWRGELRASVVPSSVTSSRHLARRLQWDAYRPVLDAVDDPIEFDLTYQLEPLADEHIDHLAEVSDDVTALQLRDPPIEIDPALERWFDSLAAPRWLVVHGGPPGELAELVEYATDIARAEGQAPTIAAVSPSADAVGVRVERIDSYPAWPLFARADRVITGAGFNAMRQAAALAGSDRHRFMPFPRRYDDQFGRARSARSWTRPA
jgi:hypothetical protein